MATKKELLERMEQLHKAAVSVLSDLTRAQGILAEHQVTSYTGVKLVFTDVTQGEPGKKAIDAAIIEVRRILNDVERKYGKVFQEELKYLTPERLYRFKCLPAVTALASVDYLDMVSKSIEAMSNRLKKIVDKMKELNAMAVDGVIHQGALNAFFSYSNLRILDTHTEEEQIKRDFQREKFKEDQDAAELLKANAEGQETSTLLQVLGLVTSPLTSVNEGFEAFNRSLLSLQYPRSLRYCNPRRNEMTSEALRQSRIERATKANEVNKTLSKDRPRSGPPLGEQYLQSSEFQELDTAVQRSLQRYEAKNGPSRALSQKQSYDNYVRSIKRSTSSAEIKGVIREIQILRANLDLSS